MSFLPLVSSFSPLLGFDHFCSNKQNQEVYFFFFMYICIYLSPTLSWIFAFRIVPKRRTRILFITFSWPDLVCASVVGKVLSISLFLSLRSLATKSKEESLSWVLIKVRISKFLSTLSLGW
jgi:hypothetical protein